MIQKYTDYKKIYSDWTEMKTVQPTLKFIILTKFHNHRAKIVNILVLA